MQRLTTLFSSALILLCAQGISTAAQAQTDPAVNSLVAGAKALQFEINSDFDLSSFQGTVISYKKQTSPGSATRIGLSLNLTVNESDETGLRNDGATQFNRFDDNRQSIRLDIQRVFYSSPANRTSFFWGLGPYASFSRSEVDRSNGSTTPTPVTAISNRKTEISTWAGGVAALAGVELFLAKKVSLLAEYNLDLSYSRRKTSTRAEDFLNGVLTSGEDIENTRKSLNLTAQQVKFGVSVYFL